MAWCFSIRSSVTTVPITFPAVYGSNLHTIWAQVKFTINLCFMIQSIQLKMKKKMKIQSSSPTVVIQLWNLLELHCNKHNRYIVTNITMETKSVTSKEASTVCLCIVNLPCYGNSSTTPSASISEKNNKQSSDIHFQENKLRLKSFTTNQVTWKIKWLFHLIA